MKNCDQFRELFSAYALGALDVKERGALEAQSRRWLPGLRRPACFDGPGGRALGHA